jgi:hypothetical protein
MAGSTQPFRVGETITITPNGGSVSAPLPPQGSSVVICNATADIAFITFSMGTTLTASAANYPIPAGTRALVDIGPLANIAAVFCAATTGAVYITRGEGDSY